VQDTGGKKGKFMKKSTIKNKQFKGTFGDLEQVADFLPGPEELMLKDEPEKVKVTLNLNKTSVDRFKKKANALGGSYQRMMRNLIDHYAQTMAE
jgi:predicted DNA binding CopG/RHH family protein